MHSRAALIVDSRGSRCGQCRIAVYHDTTDCCPQCGVKFEVLEVADMRLCSKFPRLRSQLPVKIRGRSNTPAPKVRRSGMPLPGSPLNGHLATVRTVAAVLPTTPVSTSTKPRVALRQIVTSSPVPLVPDSPA